MVVAFSYPSTVPNKVPVDIWMACSYTTLSGDVKRFNFIHTTVGSALISDSKNNLTAFF